MCREILRVRVRIDIRKPLKRWLRVDVMRDGNETVIVLRYERLPNYCFLCGRVDHVMKECPGSEPIPVVNGIETLSYGT